MKNLTTFEKALIGSSTGGMAGAFTYVCLLPLDTIKTKLQTKGATQIYKGSVDVIVKTFQAKGILGFYSGIPAVIVGSTVSSAIYFGTLLAKTKKGHLEPFERVCVGALAGLIAMAFLLGGNNQLDTLIWYSWLGGNYNRTMIGSNMVLEEHYKGRVQEILSFLEVEGVAEAAQIPDATWEPSALPRA
ncbi:hypothetical protein IFM89_023172 [Coptis chinensis]|uniref:Uncharacterized protein n=1 Tax=Coptis chinensis TaxID=261450 RepID=A0A835HVQ0_9MAGN|nr:hypothetical protein IFM89_023172 [Coptis chinensis]